MHPPEGGQAFHDCAWAHDTPFVRRSAIIRAIFSIFYPNPGIKGVSCRKWRRARGVSRTAAGDVLAV